MGSARSAGRGVRRAWALSLLLLGAASPARADDAEVWLTLEGRVPVSPPHGPLPTFFRFLPQARWRAPPVDLELIQVRAGPMWVVHENFRGAFSLLARAQNGPGGRFLHEYRLELEPTVLFPLGPVRVSDRQRLEARWLQDGMRWRYRNQLGLSLEPEGARWIPFASQEVFVGLSGEGLNESRTVLGLARDSRQGTRLEAGYQLRVQKQGAAWRVSHILLLTFVFAPPPPPLPPEAE